MKPILLFSGANDRAVIAFCRFAESTALSFAIVANGEDDLVFLSEYKKNVIATREKNLLHWDNFSNFATVVKHKFSSDELFVLPLTEYINRFLLEHKDQIENENITFGLCDASLYAKISDKYDFGSLCEKYNINVPKEFKTKPNFFPYIIKPKAYFNASHSVNAKPALIFNKQQEDQFLSNVNQDEVFFQEYVGGKSIYLLFYFFKDKSFSVYSQENFMQQHNGGSMIVAKSSEYHLDATLVQSYVNLFQKEHFHGLVMVEVKQYNGKQYMIEANPRFWGPSQLILDAKMSLFEDFCFDNKLLHNRKIKTTDYLKDTTYFWSGGLVETQKSKAQLMLYDYNNENYLNDYSNLISNEIYLRNDTIQIYLKENT